MSQSTVSRATQAPAPLLPVNTVYLFVLLAIASVGLVWANNEFVMTRESLASLAGSAIQSYQIDLQYQTIQRYAWWGYVAAPLQTAARVAFVALVIQLACLLGAIEIRFGRLFRIASVAFVATLIGSVLQIIWIARTPSAIHQASLGIVPDSLAAWIGVSTGAPSLFALLLNRFSLTSLLWILLLLWGLKRSTNLRGSTATVIVIAVWAFVCAMQVGTSMLASRLVL